MSVLDILGIDMTDESEEIHRAYDDQKNDQIDFPSYEQCRINFMDAVMKDNYIAARNHFSEAVSVCDTDPDIYRIYFDYLSCKLSEGSILHEKDAHLMTINRLIWLCPDDHSYLLKRADLCLNIEFYDNAICDYSILLGMFPDNLEIPFHLAAAYGKIGNIRQKTHYINQICDKYSKTQNRLRMDKNQMSGSISTEEQIEANQRVFKQIERVPVDTSILNIFLPKIIVAIGTLIGLVLAAIARTFGWI